MIMPTPFYIGDAPAVFQMLPETYPSLDPYPSLCKTHHRNRHSLATTPRQRPHPPLVHSHYPYLRCRHRPWTPLLTRLPSPSTFHPCLRSCPRPSSHCCPTPQKSSPSAALYRSAPKRQMSNPAMSRQHRSQCGCNHEMSCTRGDSAGNSRIMHTTHLIPYQPTRAPSHMFVDLAATAPRR